MSPRLCTDFACDLPRTDCRPCAHSSARRRAAAATNGADCGDGGGVDWSSALTWL